MKIYLVTQGEYSDYQILGAFSTEEKAQQFAAGHGTIEPFEVDDPENDLRGFRTMWCINIYLETGNMHHPFGGPQQGAWERVFREV
jgi:hypothetical protein